MSEYLVTFRDGSTERVMAESAILAYAATAALERQRHTLAVFVKVSR